MNATRPQSKNISEAVSVLFWFLFFPPQMFKDCFRFVLPCCICSCRLYLFVVNRNKDLCNVICVCGLQFSGWFIFLEDVCPVHSFSYLDVALKQFEL